MAAIASTAVSIYPTGSDRYIGNKTDLVQRNLKITGVTAADTATAAALGFSKLVEVSSGYNGSSAGAVAIGLDSVNNGIHIGSGPSNATIYLVVTGNPVMAR